MDIASIGPPVASLVNRNSGKHSDELKKAAESFEALFVGQLLKSARESASVGGLGDEDNAGGTMMEMAEEHLAQQIAQGGGCGFAKTILAQLSSPAVRPSRE